MNAKKFSDAMSELDTKYVDEALNYKKKAKKPIWVKWGAIAACLCLMIPLTAFAVDIIQYNAAVDYLNSLGIAVEDLSDYSHKEIKEAAKTIDAGESNPLTEEILSLIPENKEPLDTPTQVTSEQIKELTPTMTREDVLSLLGDTQDVGSGIYIYLYEVDQQYLLRIPFASEKLRDMGLSSEEIFAIHVLVGVSTVGVSKYQTRKLYDNWDDFKEVMYDVGKRTDLTDKQKVNKIKKLFKHVGDKTDINIPEHVRYLKGFSKEGVPIYDWPDNLGFDISTIQGISKENSLPLKWDRYGSLYGTNFATNSNPPYTYSERALPYVFNQDAYHSGKFVTETYFDKIDAIKNNDLNALNSILSIEDIPPVNSEYFERLQENFRNYKMSCNNLIDSDYGIFGKANAWDKLSGGADQIVTPLNGVQFERLGILINKR